MKITIAPRGYARINAHNEKTMREYMRLLDTGYRGVEAPTFICTRCYKRVKIMQCTSDKGSGLVCLDCRKKL